MSEVEWSRVWDLFERAVARPAGERPAWLDEHCGGDTALRRTVDNLLAADAEDDVFFDDPLVTPHSTRTPTVSGGGSGGGRAPSQGSGPLAAALGRGGLAEGTELGPYRVLRRIGQGGMSAVYLAVRDDDAFQRRVVIKLVRPDMESETFLERLRAERRILAGLEHPNIARLYDGGSTEDGLPYFVMEYVEGEEIDRWCEIHQLDLGERLALFIKVCSAVHYAHQNLVVHRDLKPSNILVGADGEPKLLDFGIAKLLNPELAGSGLEPTVTAQRLLTPTYASPEQLRGVAITTGSDVYSLGVLLYKLLTGRLPYDLSGRSVRQIEKLLSETEPLPPSVAVTRSQPMGRGAPEYGNGGVEALGRQLAGDLDAIVLKALRTAARRRYGSVEQLVQDLERYREGRPVEARAGSWAYRAGKFMRRHRRAVAASAGVALLLLGFGVASTLQARRVAFERDQAWQARDQKAQVLSLMLELFRYSNPFVAPGEELTVREALERSVTLIEGELLEQPDVRAELLYTSGSILGELGSYEQAKIQLSEALELRKDLYGEEHPTVAEAMSALAAAHKELGDLETAESQARRALELARSVTAEGVGADGAEGLFTAGPLNNLVSVLCYRSDYEAAEHLAREALDLTSQLPEGDPKTITALEHLARVESALGDFRGAAQLNREALALRRAQYGEQHPGQIATLNNLGMNLRRLDELAAAESNYRQALSIHEASFGPEHDDVYLLNNLASIYFVRQDFVESERLYQRARDAIHRIDTEHWMVYLFESRVARSRTFQGLAADAEQRLRRLLETWRPRLGEHWQIDEGESLLGESLSFQGRYAEAEPLLIQSFERLLTKAKARSQQDAYDRLEAHFVRRGTPEKSDRFRAMLDP